MKITTVIKLDDADDETRKAVVNTMLMAYVGERCRICGDTITPEAVKSVVWAGIGKTGGRTAHQECFDACKQKSEWAHPDDAG